jgi:hypothetical protein
MARKGSWTWTVIISLLIGALGASIFWLYSPYGHDQLAQQVANDLQEQRLPVAAKGNVLSPRKLTSQALGPRFQMVADGKQVFLVDLKYGRVWRYFHQTKEGGFSKEDEGFLPIGMYYGGQKHYSAGEIEAPPPAPAGPTQPTSGGKQSR